MKNAKELHYEHRVWLSSLAEFEDDIVFLAKHHNGKFNKEIGDLLKICVNLKKSITDHEKTIALAFKSCGINIYDEIFYDHIYFRKKFELLRLKLANLRVLILKDDIYQSKM
ncbi:MAG: hypothetical protein HOE90_06465 [Bacteriovoracaceae bacterium]|jgi:hypothetical protein|nr:hypothetical protein [Bacteriovoracaceae bacterium]